MKEEFVRCEFCKTEIPLEACQLAAYRTVIDGKRYTFCCEKCAQRYQKTKKELHR
jgi:YHS domain-containing protein